MSDLETKDGVFVVGAASDTIPTLTREALLAEFGEDCTDERMNHGRDYWQQGLEAAMKRGPVTLDFGQGNYGAVSGFDHVTNESLYFPAHGRIEVSQYVILKFTELSMLPADLAATFPFDVFDRVELLGACDDVIRAIAHNPRQGSLTVYGPIDEDFVARHLEMDPNSKVQVGGSQISDEAFAELAHATGLRGLSVTGTLATDATIGAVARALPQLTYFDVTGPVLTGSFCAELGDMHSLEGLGISGESVTGSALSSMATLESVEGIDIGGPHSLDGLDIDAFLGALPNLTGAGWSDGTKPFEMTDLLPLHAARPGLMLNDTTLSAKAIARLARVRDAAV